MIHISHIDKIYKSPLYEVKALEDISLEIHRGEFVCIMGESGSGKSTLLHILGCMDQASGGTYTLNKQLIHQLNSKKLSEIRNKSISFIFQDFALMDGYTARENVALPLLKRKLSRRDIKNKVVSSFESLGIIDLIDRLPSEMSGGQKQRVAIARAIASEAEIIIADEPTGALDSGTTHTLMALLKGLNDSGKTLIVVTHDKEVAAYADRIIYLSDGRIIDMDRAEERELMG